jgi:predicted transposase YbfD/YdcC
MALFAGATMAEASNSSITHHFKRLPDPRINRTRRHELQDVMAVALCAVICGADDWAAVERFGKAKLDWFRTFLALPNSIPSHDTFGRIFAALDPEAFKSCFLDWVKALTKDLAGEVVAIDGKTLRHTFDTAADKAAIHMVSAWASAQGVCLGQIKTEAKSNEITAIPKLLERLALKGCIVTIDAMGCQKEIARAIHDREADYVLSLKGNQGLFHDEIKVFLNDSVDSGFQDITHSFIQTVDGDHGRIEVRRVWATEDIAWLHDRDRWPGLRSLIIIESDRTIREKTTCERRLYISSLPADATKLANVIRSHWGIENSLHWILDVAMNQDQNRTRKGNAPDNLAVLHHIALNLLKQDTTAKLGIKNRRLAAGWDHDYLLHILMGGSEN